MSQFTMATERTCLVDAPEVELVREIEADLVPTGCHGWPGAKVAARRLASAGLGGDFHSVIPGSGERYSLVVGTVAGPGLFAALGKAVLSSAARKLGRTRQSTAAMMSHLQGLLRRINVDLRNQRVTCALFHGVVDQHPGTLEYCAAGPCHAFVWTRGGELLDLRSTGPALGAREDVECESQSYDVHGLQRLIVFSEGLTTASCASGEPFGLARGRCLVTDTVRLPIEEQVDAIVRALREHVGTNSMFTEDATVFVTEFDEGAASREAFEAEAWLRSFKPDTGEVPDSSVYLG